MTCINKNLSLNGKVWKFFESDHRENEFVRQKLNLPLMASKILINRLSNLNLEGDSLDHSTITMKSEKILENYNAFLNPKIKNLLSNPFEFVDMKKSVNLILSNIFCNKKIGIISDYDVDGATSSALMFRFLNKIYDFSHNIRNNLYKTGIDVYDSYDTKDFDYVVVKIPHRIHDGYGPAKYMFDEFKKNNIDLVLTLDCGTTAFEAIEYAHEIGIKVIVIDHHATKNQELKAFGLINPHDFRISQVLFNETKHLAAVGVCFFVCTAICMQLKLICQKNTLNSSEYDEEIDLDVRFSLSDTEKNFLSDFGDIGCAIKKQIFQEQVYVLLAEYLMNMLDLVAVGTICDMMVIDRINRAFVKNGLNLIRKQRNIGLKHLCMINNIDTKINTDHIGYSIGPQINAGGRIGNDQYLGFKILTTDNEIEALQIVNELNILNHMRRDINDLAEIEAEIMAKIQNIDDENFQYMVAQSQNNLSNDIFSNQSSRSVICKSISNNMNVEHANNLLKIPHVESGSDDICHSKVWSENMSNDTDVISHDNILIHCDKSSVQELSDTGSAIFARDRFISVVGDWHCGVIGIVASRLKEKFNRPTFVMTSHSGAEDDALHACQDKFSILSDKQDINCCKIHASIDKNASINKNLYESDIKNSNFKSMYKDGTSILDKDCAKKFDLSHENTVILKGSGRSVKGLHIGSLIQKAVTLNILENGGGHAMACGFSIKKQKIASFQKFLSDELMSFVCEPDCILIDSVIACSAVNMNLLNEIDMCAPYGVGVSKPLFLLHNVLIVSFLKIKQKHLRLVLTDGVSINVMVFNIKYSIEQFIKNSFNLKKNISCVISISEWNGAVSCKLEDIIDVNHCL